MAEFKRDLLFYAGINTYTGSMYNIGNVTMLGNGSYFEQLEVEQITVTGNAVIPGIQFDSLTVAGNVVSGGNFIGNGALMTGVTSTLPTQASLDIVGNVTAPGNVAAQYFIGNGSALTGLLSKLPVSAKIDITGNVTAPGNVNAGQLTAAGNVQGQYFIGNGSALSGITPVITGGVANVDIFGNVTAPGYVTTTGKIIMLGNAAANYFIGNGAFLSGLNAVNAALPPTGNIDIRGNVIAPGNVNVAGQLIVAGNVQGNYFIGNGALMTGITSGITGGVANADIFGNVIAPGNVTTAGKLVMLGNAVGNYFIGNGALLTGLSGVNAILPSTGNIDITGNVIAPGNISVAGQVDVTGNVAGRFFRGNGSALTGIVPVLSGGVVNIDIFGNVKAPGNVTTTGKLVSLGNATGNYFIGNGALMTGITGVIAVIPPTANIDIRGNVRASGNVIVAGQVNAIGNVSGNFFAGDGSKLTGIMANAISPVSTFTSYGTSATVGTSITTSNLIFTTDQYISVGAANNTSLNIAALGVNLAGQLAALANNGTVPQTKLEGYLIVPKGTVPDEQARLALGGGAAPIGTLVTDSDTGNIYLLTASPSNVALNWLEVGSGNFHVGAVFGRTGDVISALGDYKTNQVTLTQSVGTIPAGNTVQRALTYLENNKANIVSGNVIANSFFGNGALLTGLDVVVEDLPPTGCCDIVGNVVAPGNISVSGLKMTVFGNVTANTFIGSGFYMENIISTVPARANLDIVGNVIAPGNVVCNRLIIPAANLSANYLLGNGSSLLSSLNYQWPGFARTDIIGNVTSAGDLRNILGGELTSTFGAVRAGQYLKGNGSTLTNYPFGGFLAGNLAVNTSNVFIFNKQTYFTWNGPAFGDPLAFDLNIKPIPAFVVNASVNTGNGAYEGAQNGWRFFNDQKGEAFASNALYWQVDFDFYRSFAVHFSIYVSKIGPGWWITVGSGDAGNGYYPDDRPGKTPQGALSVVVLPGRYENYSNVLFYTPTGLVSTVKKILHSGPGWTSYALFVRDIGGTRYMTLENLSLGTIEASEDVTAWINGMNLNRGLTTLLIGGANDVYDWGSVYLNNVTLSYI